MSRSSFYILISISCLFISLFWRIPESCSETYPFNEESVFCTYFILSGDEVNEQDVEEFCFVSGRPVYTTFKPSEMFSKQGIFREKTEIISKMEEMGEGFLFIWELTPRSFYVKRGDGGKRFVIDYTNLPQPTHFINSEITGSGKRLLGKAIDSYLKKNKEKYDSDDLHIKVILRPEKTVYSYQKRNIVHEDVVLPIRYVIFHPIEIRIFDETMTID